MLAWITESGHISAICTAVQRMGTKLLRAAALTGCVMTKVSFDAKENNNYFIVDRKNEYCLAIYIAYIHLYYTSINRTISYPWNKASCMVNVKKGIFHSDSLT